MAALGYISATLPSRGLLYEKLPEGKVDFRRLTVDEDLLIQSTTSGTALVSALLSACCKFPEGFDHTQLLATDRMALLLAMRVFTFGAKYGYTYRCQNCDKPQRAECDLTTDLKTKAAGDDLTEPMDVVLPISETTVSLRFLRGADEDMLANKAQEKGANALALNLVTQLAMQIVEVGGTVMPELSAREKFVRQLPIPDAELLRAALDDKETGIDLRLYPKCNDPECNHVSTVSLPFDLNFFRQTRR